MDANAHRQLTKSGRRVKAACTNCKKAKAKCDRGRPCTRCVERGLPHCVDAFPRRVGRRRNHFFNNILTEVEVKAIQSHLPKKKKAKRSRKRAAKRTVRDEERKTPPLAANKRFKAQVPVLKLEEPNSGADGSNSSFSMDIFKVPSQLGLHDMPKLDFAPKQDITKGSDLENTSLPMTPKFEFPTDLNLPGKWAAQGDVQVPAPAPSCNPISSPSVHSDASNENKPPVLDRGLSFLDRPLSMGFVKPSSPSTTEGSYCSSSCSDLPTFEDVGDLGFLVDDPFSGLGFDNDVFDIELPQNLSVSY
uniref:Zn(2)-C6 fungal-type domain-containing protein n=1 Tax=Lotharella oceanica TaxID=641309 RepID=A0A7S2TGB2_9EUKA